MREIKFRVWDDVSQKYIDENTFIDSSGQLWIWDKFKKTIGPHGFIKFKTSEPIIELFTGLKDKNGKEIYEGDILEFVDKWEWYRGEWAPKFFFASPEKHKKLEKEFEQLPTEKRLVEFDVREGVSFSVYDNEQGRWAVIGNIHENKELLEKN